jgi:hypothetical protein
VQVRRLPPRKKEKQWHQLLLPRRIWRGRTLEQVWAPALAQRLGLELELELELVLELGLK